MIGLNNHKTNKTNSLVNVNKDNKHFFNNNKNIVTFNNKIDVSNANRGRNSRQFGSDITNTINNQEALKLKHNNFKNFTNKNLIINEPLSKSISVFALPNANNKQEKQINNINVNNSINCNSYNYNNIQQNNNVNFQTTSSNNSSVEIANNFNYNINKDNKACINKLNQNLLNNKICPQIAVEYLESIVNTLFEAENQTKEIEFRKNVNELIFIKKDQTNINNNITSNLFDNSSCNNLIVEASKYYATPDYMNSFQTEINDRMRAILFNWLVDVHYKWKLMPETLFLTFNLIDRYLSLKNTMKEELQCVGVSALLIACKYEEIYFPELHDFREITDNTFSKSDILKKEFEILNLLEFDLTFPSILRFFEAFNVVLNLTIVQKYSCFFLMELCAFEYNLIKNKPSLIASGCILFVSWNNINLKKKLLEISRQTEEDLINIFKEILIIYQKTDNGSKSIKRKYSSSKFQCVGNINLIKEYINSNFDNSQSSSNYKEENIYN